MKPAFVINFSISILLIASMGCSKPADQAQVESSKVVEQPLVGSNQPVIPLSLEIDHQSGGLHPSQAAIKLVQGARSGPEAYYVIIAVHELLKSWKPEGKSTEDVIRVLGPPSASEEGNLIYTYQSTDARYIWKFLVTKGVIQTFEKSFVSLCG